MRALGGETQQDGRESGVSVPILTASRGEVAFEECPGGPFLLPPGLLEEQVTVGVESCASRS